jgi:mutator protein MutT
MDPSIDAPNSSPDARIEAAIAIVVRWPRGSSNGPRVLISQRKRDDTFGGLWEFPGGKREDCETLEGCLARELREELDIVARPTLQLPPIEHDYSHAQLRLHPFVCEHVSGEPKHLECDDTRWVAPSELRDYPFPPANEALIERVIELLSKAQ